MEARAVIQSAPEMAGLEPVELLEAGDRVVASVRWQDEEGQEHRAYRVLTFRDGKIVHMQDCRNRSSALRLARRG